MMSLPLVIQAAQDPTLIRGIYDTCDQWCMYCPATDRCLAYRCREQATSGGDGLYHRLAGRLFEGLAFLKALCAAEVRPTPGLDALLAEDPRRTTQVNDPLERLGRRYMRLSDAYLLSRQDFPFEMKRRDAGPTPFEVFAWYHALVPAKVYRALASAAEAARGEPDRRRDALMSAKVALIGMDRSLKALAAMAAEDDDASLELMQVQLNRLRREVEARFPEARATVRPGLDSGDD